MSDTVSQIKERLDIAEFVRGYVQLSPAGKNLKGVCPFHKEKTPSFIVSPERQIWHCFGCSAGGDIITFAMKYENLEFTEALKVLADKAGIDMGRLGTQDQKQFNLLYEINRKAKDFFKNNLNSANGDKAREYLASRGLKKETIEEFEIGLTSDLPDALIRHLIGTGFNIVQIEKAGLAIKTERGTYFDRFRSRVMFPLLNAFGKVVGFTGRIMPGFESEKIGKYVNSPETPIFNKSKLLFGLDKSKNFIRESRTAVLVEGQMDFIMAWQDGVKNLAATSGTALTADHLKVLKRIAGSLILSFDQDEAGKLATERTVDLANALDFSVKILRVPEDIKAKDPADIAVAKPGLLKELADNAQVAMQYYLEKYNIGKIRHGNVPISEIKSNIRAILAKITNLYSPVEKSHWLKKLSEESGLSEESIGEELDALNISAKPQAEEIEESPAPDAPLSRKEGISQRIATLAMAGQEFGKYLEGSLVHLPEQYRTIISSSLSGEALPANYQKIADLIILKAGLETNLDPLVVKKELEALLHQLKLENLKEKRQASLVSIQNAERNNNDPALGEALSEFDRISKEIQNL